MNRAGSFRVNAERLMGPIVTEERPKGNVSAKQSVFSHHVCIISDTSGHGGSLFLVCIHTTETQTVALYRPQHSPHPNCLTPLSFLTEQES